MCVKASLFVLCVCFFVHASNALPIPISHAQKIEVEAVKLNKFGPNRRVTFGERMPIRSITEDPSKKNNRAIKGGASRADYKSSSLHKALMQRTKSELDSRWGEVNVREMDSSIFSEEALSETDYQPPHRKAPIHNK